MLEKIKELVAGFMGIRVSDVLEDASLLEMGMDSLTLLKVIMDIEKSYDIYFLDEEIIEIKTITDILDMVQKKTS